MFYEQFGWTTVVQSGKFLQGRNIQNKTISCIHLFEWTQKYKINDDV